MPHRFNISRIISLIKGNSLTSGVQIIIIDEVEKRGFYKLRCTLIPSRYKLDIKFIKTEAEFLYSYQLYADKSIARWDNEPHYPALENYPHHYHDSKSVRASELSGNPVSDIRKVFSSVADLIGSI